MPFPVDGASWRLVAGVGAAWRRHNGAASPEVKAIVAGALVELKKLLFPHVDHVSGEGQEFLTMLQGLAGRRFRPRRPSDEDAEEASPGVERAMDGVVEVHPSSCEDLKWQEGNVEETEQEEGARNATTGAVAQGLETTAQLLMAQNEAARLKEALNALVLLQIVEGGEDASDTPEVWLATSQAHDANKEMARLYGVLEGAREEGENELRD